ncbi:MAG: isopenicillin N synthase family oxygenase [Caulobacteraceae bacterium]|nr:MAG: isopenicillin N synthase family oxygenase [Caulobacteraceae bacterium]
MTQSVSAPSAIAPVSFTQYERDFAGFSRALGDSFRRYGFAVISDTGMGQEKIDSAIQRAKEFFALPEADKKKYFVEGGKGQRGYTPFGVETAKGAAHFDLKEFWHVGRELPAGHRYSASMPQNLWVSEVEGFKEELTWLFNVLDRMGGKVLQAIAAYLGLDRHTFDDQVRDGNSILRLLHYPAAGFDGPNERAGAHEDINAITLLLGAEEGGLEVLDRDGRWLPINPPAGSLVVNIGDMLSRATNDYLPSTTHRVVNPPPERRNVPRYSTPFFLHYAPDHLIETLPGRVDAEHPDKYPTPITADDFLKQRLAEIKLG